MALPPPPSPFLSRRQLDAVARLERFIDEQLATDRARGCRRIDIRLPEAVDADVADALRRRYLGAGWSSVVIGEEPGRGWAIQLEALIDVHLAYAFTGGPR